LCQLGYGGRRTILPHRPAPADVKADWRRRSPRSYSGRARPDVESRAGQPAGTRDDRGRMSRTGHAGRALRRYRAKLQHEPVAGAVLLLGALGALVWANSPWGQTYVGLTEFVVGPASWHLDLPLGDWAADGLLAVFFFVVGLELKTEFVSG